MGMEEVETAAADTTSSEHSSGRHLGGDHYMDPAHLTSPSYPAANNNNQSLSYHDHPPSSWETTHHHQCLAANEQQDDSPTDSSPAAKRQRTESYGSGSGGGSGQGLQMSPETSVHVRRHHGSRPVGIAQPIQLQDTQLHVQHQYQEQSETLFRVEYDAADVQKHKASSHTSIQQQQQQKHSTIPPNGSDSDSSKSLAQVQSAVKSRQSSNTFGDQETTTTTTEFCSDLVTPLDRRSSSDYFDDVYDSDQSQEMQRFDKFNNESNTSSSVGGGSSHPSFGESLPMKETKLDSAQESTASEASSESTLHFVSTYASSDNYAHPSTVQSDVKYQDLPHSDFPCGEMSGQGTQQASEHWHTSSSLMTQQERKAHRSTHERNRPRESRRNPSSKVLTSQTSEGLLPLPPGKNWHLFVSHSTSSQDWASAKIVAQLRGPPHHMKVAACYESMPDSSRYDDKEIQSRMRESCVVLIALTQSYLNSQRCKMEWKLAVSLHHEGLLPQLVVAAVERCSRPEPLKSFLYLDFIDGSKFGTVWDMLLKKINDTVLKCLPVKPSPPLHQSYDEDRQNHDEGDIFSQPIPLVGGSMSGEEEEGGGGGVDHHGGAPQDVSSPCSSFSFYDQRQHLLQELQQSGGGTLSQSTSEVETDDALTESYHKHLKADFERMYEEFGQVNLPSKEETDSESGTVAGSDVVTDPRASKTIDLSRTGELVGQVVQDERGSEVAEGMEGVGKDVEEGEVSDSSDEMAGGTRDKKTKNESEVAKFYNKLAQPDADRRNESPIFFMRNFNNWVKSILIRSHLSQLTPGATVLDLCCGKGGDLLKWKEGGISYLICADISEDSVKTCENGRYYSDKMINKVTRKPPFEAEFIVADCCEVRLRDQYVNPARRFNLTSCQFSIHYSFESYGRAHMMVRNACENLRPGGYFIGTTVDSNEVIHRLRRAGQNEEGLWSIGNDIFTVTLDPSLDINNLPLFGARYNFKLHGVVDLPEFLVHFPLLIDMLKDFDMELVLRQNFYDFFAERRYNTEDILLLHRMKAFDPRKGTMSASEWEAVGLYLVFVFRKRDRDRQRRHS